MVLQQLVILNDKTIIARVGEGIVNAIGSAESHYDVLKMRPERNFIPDEQLKLKWLNEMDWKEDVEAVFDDRQKVVDMWREIGLTCAQVAPGNF